MNTSLLFRSLGLTALVALVAFTGCSSQPTSIINWTLPNTVWKVAEINGEMVGADKIPAIQLFAEGSRVTAFGGINHMSGTYTLNGAALAFGPMASTRMAGDPKQMKIEMQFAQMLGTVTNYRIAGPWLVLLAGDKVVARAQASAALTDAETLAPPPAGK
jgi:heat shock protein HslJ